ncbi:MAG: hypothetical protein IJH64_00160 [Oscillospiraceae bacterium]|nr:hypothetical protein [Oscillospiraceae bacterium]
MSYFAEYRHGLISRQELLNAFNMDRSNHDPEDRISTEDICWNEGTGEGDCNLCDHKFECAGSPYSEEDDE